MTAPGSPLLPSPLREVAPGIFYTDSPFVGLDNRVIALLKSVAAALPQRRARFCAHPNPDAEQQEMLIVSHRDGYVRPHRHKTRSEGMLVLEGEADAFLFSDEGRCTDRIALGTAGSERTFFYRMPAGQYHGLRIDSEFLVFLETTRGPFRHEDSEMAPWSPQDVAAGREFMRSLGNAR